MNNSKINVAQLIGSLGGGGAEQQVVQLVNHLDESRFNKRVVVFWDKTTGFKDCLSSGVKYYSLQYRRRTMPVGIFKLARHLKKNKIDILHCHMYDPNKIGSMVGKLVGVPVIITTEHGKNPWKKWRHHFVEKKIINRIVKKRIAVSEDIKGIRIKYDGVLPQQIISIPNGVVVPDYNKDTTQTPKVIGSMGRLVEAKDFPSLFQAVKIVKEIGFDIELKIAGEGHLEDELKKCINDLGMAQNIKLIGFQKQDVFLKQIDIFAMSSIREGMPVALLEAMSYGLPLVATKVGGILEVVQDEKDGLLSDPQQPQAMAENIIRIIQDKNLRNQLGNNAKNKIIEKYSIEKIANRYGQLYIELLNNR